MALSLKIMVVTGEEDWRTPISESEQYHKALKLLNVESVMVRVPDESHGIRQRPNHRVAKMLNRTAAAGAAPSSKMKAWQLAFGFQNCAV